jgi:hypothetical protein
MAEGKQMLNFILMAAERSLEAILELIEQYIDLITPITE